MVVQKKNKKPYIRRPFRYHLRFASASPIIPEFILKDFFNQFTEVQQKTIFRMLGCLNEFYKHKHRINHTFFIEYIGVLYFFNDNIMKDLKETYSLRKNGVKALIAVYYMQTILNRGVTRKEITPLFKYGTDPKNRTCLPSLKWLQSVGLLDRKIGGHFYYMSVEGKKVIRYISDRVTVYKREFIQKQAEFKFMAKHSKIRTI